MQETIEDCSWQEVYKLNGVVVNGDEDFDALDYDEIDTIVIGFTSPMKPFAKFSLPEILIER